MRDRHASHVLVQISFLGGLCLMACRPAADAAGFALIEQGGSGQGRAFAGAAAVADDASTIYFNAAGLTELEGHQLVVAGHWVMPEAEFTNEGSRTAAGEPLPGDGSTNEDVLVPNLYYAAELRERLHVGLGINAPFGLSTQYDKDWPGRYHALDSDLVAINLNPSLAYQVSDHLSLGAGLNAQYADAELTSAVDAGGLCQAQELAGNVPAGTCTASGLAPQASDGLAEINGDSWGFGFNLGLLYQPIDGTRVGLAYRSQIDQDVEGEADFALPQGADFLTAGGAFVDADARADLTMPDSASLAIAHQVGERMTLLASVTWTGWSDFEELRIEFDSNQPDSVTTEQWDDTYRVAAGLDYRATDRWTLRTGVAFDESPIPSPERRTARIPGNDRYWLSVGAGYRLSERLSFDIAYSHIFVEDAEIDNTLESSVPTLRHTLSGEYDSNVDVLAAQLTWRLW